MYIPADLGRLYAKPQGPTQFQQMLNNNILPIQGIDPNRMFRLSDEDFSFEHLDGLFKPDLGIRISRTPLLSSDPNTYVALSKYVEQNLRKYHTSLGNVNLATSTQLQRPPESVGVTNGKTEVLPVGCAINPLTSDPFKNVHLIPGCCARIIDWDVDMDTSYVNGNGVTNSNNNSKMFGKAFMGQTKTSHQTSRSSSAPFDNLKPPKNNLNRSTSTFLAKVITCDNMLKRLNATKSILITGHGRLFNIFSLEDEFKDFDIEIPLLKVNVTASVISTMSVFQYYTSNGEKNLDILIGYSSGDILWINPFKMKYSRWNKNGKFTNKPVISLRWSKNGTYGIVGFGDGEVMFFHRDYDDDEYYDKTKLKIVKKDKYMKIFKSLNHVYPINTGKNQNTVVEGNPIAHYKFSRKAMTAIEPHPRYKNIVLFASDDGYIRMFDTLNETLIDISPSYYGGFLCMNITNDGRYLITGGEDDLLSIYEFTFGSPQGNLKLVTRLQGSASWVKAITVDYYKTTPGLLYRIGAVGDDGAINFYEFQPRNLPKLQKTRITNPNLNSQNHLLDNFQQKQQPQSQNEVPNSNKSKLEGKISQLGISSSSNIDGVTIPKPKNSSSTSALTKKKIFQQHKVTDSISSLKSSTEQQQQSLIELMKSTSQLSLNSGSNTLLGTEAKSSTSLVNAGLVKSPIDLKNAKRQNLRAIDVLNTNGLQTFVHHSYGLKDVPVLFPIGGKNVDLGRMFGLHFEDKYVWAFLATGELIRWLRPT